jgi:hypothetical protein
MQHNPARFSISCVKEEVFVFMLNKIYLFSAFLVLREPNDNNPKAKNDHNYASISLVAVFCVLFGSLKHLLLRFFKVHLKEILFHSCGADNLSI